MDTTGAVETKLYVTNFPSSATRQQLQQFFSHFGRVQECAIMWNSYAFVHYATMEEARHALEQSNGAMFLNRKLIVQLSTSRFRPQPKEPNPTLSQSSKQLMMINPYSQQSQYNYDMISADNIFPSQDFKYSLDSSMKLKKNIKTDIGMNGEIPKLYCTNLPDNCKANDLQRLFSTFGHVIDCVILWDYYAFITYKTFQEADRALIALNGYMWKDRRLIVEWSRASGRKQQQQQTSSSSTPPRLSSELSTPPSPRHRPSTLITSNNQYYPNNSPMKSQSPSHPTFNQNLALMSLMQPSFLHHTSIPYNAEKLSNDNQLMFDSLTHSSSNHRLDLSPFLETNSNSLFSSSSELNTPSSATSISHVYQPSDIVNLLEPSPTSDDNVSDNHKATTNSINDITNFLPSTSTNVPPSCSSAALFQENLLSSMFHSFDPFNNKYLPNNEQSSASNSRYNNNFSSLLTTAPDNNNNNNHHRHYPVSYGHNISLH